MTNETYYNVMLYFIPNGRQGTQGDRDKYDDRRMRETVIRHRCDRQACETAVRDRHREQVGQTGVRGRYDRQV